MYFLDNNSGIATMPPLKETQSTTPLWFTEGDGHKGISWPGEDWFNIQQAEQLALLDAAGIRPDKGKLNQLTLAIRAIIGQEALLKTQALAEIAAAGKGAQEKARTHLGLGKLATQDGIEEATLHRKGIVQLSSATHSADETTAATPKAVNERVNTVVDNAPSDLDTLNKLAQAISNNPTFAESVTQLLSQKLAKNENGADILDKNQFVKNLGLTETVDCAKNALDKRTGGTVNGDIISQGGQFLLKGDNRKHLGFHNQDGSVRMWLYKDKGGDGVRLNNGNDGGGDWVFNKNGHFYSPQALHAAGATYQEDGNIHGSLWGGHLSGFIANRTHSGDGWWKDENTGLMVQWGNAQNLGYQDVRTINFPRPFQHFVGSIQVTPDRAGVQRSGLIGGYASAVNNSSFNLTNDYANQGAPSNFWWLAIGK